LRLTSSVVVLLMTAGIFYSRRSWSCSCLLVMLRGLAGVPWPPPIGRTLVFLADLTRLVRTSRLLALLLPRFCSRFTRLPCGGPVTSLSCSRRQHVSSNILSPDLVVDDPSDHRARPPPSVDRKKDTGCVANPALFSAPAPEVEAPRSGEGHGLQTVVGGVRRPVPSGASDLGSRPGWRRWRLGLKSRWRIWQPSCLKVRRVTRVAG
jgi:hypothetical protein